MHLNEPTIKDSDSEFLNKQLTLLHRLKWRLYNLEQLSRYEKEFLAACESTLFIVYELLKSDLALHLKLYTN
jgi:hypothetical protein